MATIQQLHQRYTDKEGATVSSPKTGISSNVISGIYLRMLDGVKTSGKVLFGLNSQCEIQETESKEYAEGTQLRYTDDNGKEKIDSDGQTYLKEPIKPLSKKKLGEKLAKDIKEFSEKAKGCLKALQLYSSMSIYRQLQFLEIIKVLYEATDDEISAEARKLDSNMISKAEGQLYMQFIKKVMSEEARKNAGVFKFFFDPYQVTVN